MPAAWKTPSRPGCVCSVSTSAQESAHRLPHAALRAAGGGAGQRRASTRRAWRRLAMRRGARCRARGGDARALSRAAPARARDGRGRLGAPIAAEREAFNVAAPEISVTDTPGSSGGHWSRALAVGRSGTTPNEGGRCWPSSRARPGSARAGSRPRWRAACSRGGGASARSAALHEGERLPFGPWVDAMRGAGLVGWAQGRAALAPTVRAELARLFPELGAPTSTPSRAGRARADSSRGGTATLLATIAERKPLPDRAGGSAPGRRSQLRAAAGVLAAGRLADRPVLLLGTVRETFDLESDHPLVRMIGNGERRAAGEDRASAGSARGRDDRALVQTAARAWHRAGRGRTPGRGGCGAPKRRQSAADPRDAAHVWKTATGVARGPLAKLPRRVRAEVTPPRGSSG